MSTKAIRALISLVVIGGALAALLFTTMQQNAEFYKHVDEVMPQAQQWYGKSLQLHGYVVENSILRRPDSLDYRFKVKNGDSVVLASYTGVVPDTFKDGAEVVLKGHLSPDGYHVDANGVMAKCPSKYDPATSATAYDRAPAGH
jgi:cytochrome c-type biogenesis protein CcmE